MGKMRKYQWLSIFFLCMFLLSACSRNETIDDYATNKGYEQSTEVVNEEKGI